MANRDSSSKRRTLALFICGAAALIFCAQLQAVGADIDPASIPAGPFQVTPLLGLDTKYRDNIYLQENDTTGSWIFLARPSLSAAAQDRNNLYELIYKGEAGWYQESSSRDDNDYFDNTFAGRAHMEFSERYVAELYASWAALHEARGTGLTEGVIGELINRNIEYDQIDVQGSLQLGSNAGIGRLVLGAGYMDRQYQNFREFTRTRDRDEVTLDATFFYPIAPKTDLLAGYVHKAINYPNPFQNAPPLDSDENFLMVGATWEMTSKATSTGKIGYVDKNFDTSERDNWDGLSWSVELIMQPRAQDTVVVTTQRIPQETTQEGNFVNTSNVRVTWTHHWSDRVYSMFGGYYARDKYEDSINNRDDDLYNGFVRGGYQFRRWANFFAEYRYDKKDSNVDSFSYEDNTVIFGVDLSL
ncbi:MAG: outer membrane beta-barrel protein [Halioglobus sp.]|nr:outer membrane beta-barrel protein [Halioglobus sp.]